MAADAQSLSIDLDMVAVGSEDRKVLDLARALLLSQAARVEELDDLFADWLDTAQQQSKRAEKAEARVAEFESAAKMTHGAARAMNGDLRKEVRGLKARVAGLESELAAERVLHGAGKCTCHLEGTCIWCRWVAAQERVEELEEPQVGYVECPYCNMDHDVQLSRGRTNDPNRADQGGEGEPDANA